MPTLRFSRYRYDYRLTHYLFRFPAKFHPPAVRCLIDRYSNAGDLILDPFCGSGTLLVEALVTGRNAVGIDVDPVAAFISRVKSRPISPRRLETGFAALAKSLTKIRRSSSEYDRLIHDDLSPVAILRWSNTLKIPAIPNIEHWFRNYVTIDLAKLRNSILESNLDPRVRDFFLACFASIIRNASNADPVPVSGLEVTAHMRRLEEKGRRIDPFGLFEQRVKREIDGMRELWERAKESSVRVVRADATRLRGVLGSTKFDVAITSPPYNTAVDYYRRHTLEMYWLGFVRSQEDRLALAKRYVGREQVRKDHPRLKIKFENRYVDRLIEHARHISAGRERAVTHYCASMQLVLKQVAGALKANGQAIFVVGNAKWNGKRVKATKLLTELAEPHFDIVECRSYASQNRYMSYKRHNGADVNREHVIVLKKKRKKRSGVRT